MRKASPKRLLTDFDLDTTGNSPAENASALSKFGIQLIWAGVSPDGSIQMQISNDDGTTWEDRGSPVTTGGADGSGFVEELNVTFELFRFAYTRTSGTGDLQAYMLGRE